MCDPPTWGLGKVLKTHRKNVSCFEPFTQTARTWTDTLVRSKQRKICMRFVTWNVRNLYRAGSLTTVARELARCKLDLVGVQEVRWDKGDSVRSEY